MSKTIIEVEQVRGGQPRPYADAIYEAYLSCRCEGVLMHGAIFYQNLTQDHAKLLTKLFVHEFPDEPGHHFSPRLTTCEAVGPTQVMRETAHEKWTPKQESRWHVVVIVPCTD